MKYSVNRLLTDDDRISALVWIHQMTKDIPEMMSRKIPDANVQQAFAVDQVHNYGIKGLTEILSVGSYECTATEFLKKSGWNIFGIDPVLNYDLHSFYEKFRKEFHIIISVSVIEHVPDDELFMDEICKSLKPGGTAILTCDFNNSWKPGQAVPYSNYRLYTDYDLDVRLKHIIELNNCNFIGETYWKGEPDFWYQGHNYSFATIVFQKKL